MSGLLILYLMSLLYTWSKGASLQAELLEVANSKVIWTRNVKLYLIKIIVSHNGSIIALEKTKHTYQSISKKLLQEL